MERARDPLHVVLHFGSIFLEETLMQCSREHCKNSLEKIDHPKGGGKSRPRMTLLHGGKSFGIYLCLYMLIPASPHCQREFGR